MTPTPDDALQSPQGPSDSNLDPVAPPSKRFTKSPLASISGLPYRRSQTSLSTLFASTTSLPPTGTVGSPSESGVTTPQTGALNGSVFSPGGSTAALSPVVTDQTANNGIRDWILRAFSPHVSVLASQDTEELIRHKGINGGLLELLRPYGEHVQGRVTIRDSSGASRSWEDFAVRFIGVKDGLEAPRMADRRSVDSDRSRQNRSGQRASWLEYKPARLRSGGDVPQIEELVERHLTFSEEHSGPVEMDYIHAKDPNVSDPDAASPFHTLYLRRLLSGLPMVPSETFSHPVAAVIAISSRSPSPIEELRNLYDSSNTGEHRLPQWVHNEFLRYYVLIHDEDYDDITKSMALYDQMKRHFGLHCHLLRLRSTQSVPSDDDNLKLPHCEWISAAEELSEIMRREIDEDDEDPTPYIFESDASALRAFVREMVTQSIIPSMERASATWNDQVASRRRGLSGRFMSLSKRFTTFGNRNSTGPAIGGGNSNYDSVQGCYRPDAPEAIMRKLADYAVMIRDFKLAQSVYEILCQDFKNDKAWRHYAGANEMVAVSSLLGMSNVSSKVRSEMVDQYVETAYYSYITRVGAPYYALRTLVLAAELLRIRGGSALDDAARWSNRILEDRLVGAVGHALTMERVATCFTDRRGIGSFNSGDRHRKAAFWNLLSADAWLRMEKSSQAEKCLARAMRIYNKKDEKVEFEQMTAFMFALQEAVDSNRSGPQHIDGEELLGINDGDLLVEALQEESEQFGPTSPVMAHRRSISMATPAKKPLSVQTGLDPLGVIPDDKAVPLSPHASSAVPMSPLREKKDPKDEGFE